MFLKSLEGIKTEQKIAVLLSDTDTMYTKQC